MRRPSATRTAMVLGLVVVGLGLGCSHTDTTTTNGSSSGASSTAFAGPVSSSPFCAAGIELFSPRAGDYDTRPPNTGIDDVQKLQDSAPPELAADVASLMDATRADPKASTPDATVQAWIAAGNRLVDAVAKACPEGAPYWTCLGQRTAFKSVATAIDDKAPPPSTIVDQGATPEDVATKARPVSGGTRVELQRNDTTVVFGWTNATGRLLQREVVTKQGSNWAASKTTFCPS